MMRRVPQILWVGLPLLFAVANARAEGGELYLGPSFGLEVGGLTYNRPNLTATESTATPWVLLPRLGGFIRYGISDAVQLGVLYELTWYSGVGFDGVVIDNEEGRLYADYRDHTVAASIAYLLTYGYDYQGLFELSAGLAVVEFADTGFVDPSAGDPAPQYPFVPDSSSVPGVFVQARAEFDWRPLDMFALSVGPYVALRGASAGQAYGLNMHFGIMVRPALILQLGPSLAGAW